MRKIVKIFVIIILISIFQNTVFAQATTEDIRESARLFYLANKSAQAKTKFLEIPEKELKANDYLLLGNVYMDLKEKENALEAYKKAISLDKTFYQAYYNIGNIYLENYDDNEAIEYYQSALKYKKDFPYAHFNLGCAYIELGNTKKAKTSFENAIKLKPDEPIFYYNLALVHKQLNNLPKAQKAIELYNQLIKARNEAVN